MSICFDGVLKETCDSFNCNRGTDESLVFVAIPNAHLELLASRYTLSATAFA